VKKRIAPKPASKPLPPEADQWARESGIDPEIQPTNPEPKQQEEPEEKSKPFPHRVSFDMDTQQYNRLDFASFKSKQSKNKILREALENWLKEKGYLTR
jgi:hypothetical protein